MGNIQTLRKLALKMETSGTASAVENTKLYKGCYAYVWLQAYVPITQNRADDTAPLCTVHGIITDNFGVTRHLGARRYNMKLVETRTVDGYDFVLFEKKMPKPLTGAIGDLKLVFNYSEITPEGKLSSRLVSSVFYTTVEEGDESDDEIDVDLKSQEAAQINKNTLDIQFLQADAGDLRDEVSAKVDEQDSKINEALAAVDRAEDKSDIAVATANTALSTAQGIDAKAQQAINTANIARTTAERVESETAARLQVQDEALDDLRATKADKAAVYTIGQTDAAISAAIQALIGAAPEELDTLQEIVEYLKTHGNVLDSLLTEIATKANITDLNALRTDVMASLQEAVDAADSAEYYSQQASASALAAQQRATEATTEAATANTNSETAINTADRAEQKIDTAVSLLEEILHDEGILASDMREFDIVEGGAIWWTGNEAPYTLFIPSALHLLGDRVIAFAQPKVDEDTVADFYESPSYNNGDITFTSGQKWTGRVLVAGGLKEMQDTNARVDLAAETERARTAETTLGIEIADLQSGKVDKVSGKGLSSEDYTATEKNKLAGIAAGAEVNVQSDWNQTDNGADDFIKNKPTSMPASDVSAWAKAASKPAYTYSEISGRPTAYTGTGQAADGYMTQKAVTDALNALQAGAFTPYIVSVTWSGAVGNYSFTVPAATHGKGANAHVTTKINGSVIDCEPLVDASGNITIYSNANLSNIKMEVR